MCDEYEMNREKERQIKKILDMMTNDYSSEDIEFLRNLSYPTFVYIELNGDDIPPSDKNITGEVDSIDGIHHLLKPYANTDCSVTIGEMDLSWSIVSRSE